MFIRSTAADRRGFTLIELLIALVILGVLAALALPSFISLISDSEESSVRSTAQAFDRQVRAAVHSDLGLTPTANQQLAIYYPDAAGDVQNGDVSIVLYTDATDDTPATDGGDGDWTDGDEVAPTVADNANTVSCVLVYKRLNNEFAVATYVPGSDPGEAADVDSAVLPGTYDPTDAILDCPGVATPADETLLVVGH